MKNDCLKYKYNHNKGGRKCLNKVKYVQLGRLCF